MCIQRWWDGDIYMWECKCFMYTYAHTLTLSIRLPLSDLIWSDLIWSDVIWSNLIWFDLIWCIYIFFFIYLFIYIHIIWSYLILPDLVLSVYPYGYRFEPLKYRWVPEDKMRVCVCIYIYICVYTHALLWSNHHNDRCHEGEYQQYWARVFDQTEKNMGQLGPRSS